MSAINKSSIAKYFAVKGNPLKVRENCKTKFYAKEGGHLIYSRGVYGSISEVCLKNKCSYIAKIIPLALPSVKKTFYTEAIIAPIMGKLGIGPIIHDVFICLNAGFIIMDAWDGSINNILKVDIDKSTFNKKLIHKIIPLIDNMHRLGIIHNDLHTGNVLYKKTKNNNYDICITDFGLALRFDDINQIIPSEILPTSISPNIYFPAIDYYRLNESLEARLEIPFYTYFIDIGKITLLEYILLDKFLFWCRHKGDKCITFLEFLKNTDISKNMVRSLPENPNKNFSSVIKSGNKIVSLISSLDKTKSKSKSKIKSKSNINKLSK